MLTIRADQMLEFEKLAHSNAIMRIMAHVREILPQECGEMEEDALRKEVAAAMEKAKQYDIEAEAHLQVWCEIRFSCGPDFDQADWAKPILTSVELFPHEKIEKLDAAVQDL
jgi:hypothetical protein